MLTHTCRSVYGESIRPPRMLEGCHVLYQAEAFPGMGAYMALLPQDFPVSYKDILPGEHAVGTSVACVCKHLGNWCIQGGASKVAQTLVQLRPSISVLAAPNGLFGACRVVAASVTASLPPQVARAYSQTHMDGCGG